MGGVWTGRSLELVETFDFVLDTNVWIDMTNVQDFLRAVENVDPANWLSDPEVVFRAQRAGDALALACMFHEQQRTTYSLPEAARVTFRISPSEDPERSVYMAMFFNFVHEKLLPGWQFGTDPKAAETDFAEGIDDGLSNPERDDLLVEIADHNKLPFITCEGVTHGAIVDRGVRAKARARGVDVYAPIELIRARGFEAERAIRDFVDRFNTGRIAYTEKFDEEKRSNVIANLNQLGAYYTTILRNRARHSQ